MHTDKILRLRALAREVQNYQLERGLSDSKLCAKVSQVGSTKTYKRILDGDDALEELNVDKQLVNYDAAVEFIKILRASERPPEPEYDDFANIEDSLAAVARAMSEESIARFIVIEGENGTGKDAVQNALLKKWPNIILQVEATELWRESLAVPLADILNALSLRRQRDGEGEKFVVPSQPLGRLSLILEELKKRKLILLINEGHHMGPRALNMIKTLINQTPVVPVMLCIPKLLARLVSGNYEEAIQLFGNRLCERVRLSSPQVDEIVLMFERRGVRFDSDATQNQAAATLKAEAPQFGNWRYVTQVCREARTASKDRPINVGQFSAAKGIAEKRRIMRQTANN